MPVRPSPVKRRNLITIVAYESDSRLLTARPVTASGRRLRSGNLLNVETDVEVVATVNPRAGLAWMDALIMSPKRKRPVLTDEQLERWAFARAEKRFKGGLHRSGVFGDLERTTRLHLTVPELLERERQQQADSAQSRIAASRAEAAKGKKKRKRAGRK